MNHQQKINILSVADGHCSSACLLEDGVVTWAIQEERMVNVKNESGLPVNAIMEVLKHVDHINDVVLATKFIHEADWYRKQDFWEKGKKEYIMNRLSWWYKRRFDPYFVNRLSDRRKALSKLVSDLGHGCMPEDIKVVEHHLCHASSAYYCSPYEEDEKVTVVTADGSGDGLASTVSVGYSGVLGRDIGFNSTRDCSVGEIYSLVTYYLGFRPWDHEYKLMGMAPYSVVDNGLLDFFIRLCHAEDGRFVSSMSSDFAYDEIKRKLYRKRFDVICASLQEWYERVMEDWFLQLIDSGMPPRFACAGGDFMNVKGNMIVAELPEVEDIWFMPSGGDESTCIGAAQYVYAMYCLEHGLSPKKEIKPLRDLYLGVEAYPFSGGFNLESEVTRRGWSVEKVDDADKRVAEMIQNKEIVAVCRGRMEFGARALGNRSILANPSSLETIDKLNSQIKMRDFWMPFTPSLLFGHHKRYIENHHDYYAPYMIQCFMSTDEGRKDLPAAMHRYDYTIRPQMVKPDWNMRYHDLIENYFRLSGVGGVLNTSFNLHGFPIVRDASTALWTMDRCKLKYLLVDDYMVTKNG